MGFFQNACKPKGLGGRIMLEGMNRGHSAMASWGLAHLDLRQDETILDLGCGGGANLKTFLGLCPKGKVTGVDYSPLSVKKSIKHNQEAVDTGRCRVIEGDVSALQLPENSFSLVTAFETVYFWPNLLQCFRNVYQVLKDGGTFLIVNEADGKHDRDNYRARKIQGMMIYSGLQLETVLRMAGFQQIQRWETGRGWLCVLATKETKRG